MKIDDSQSRNRNLNKIWIWVEIRHIPVKLIYLFCSRSALNAYLQYTLFHTFQALDSGFFLSYGQMSWYLFSYISVLWIRIEFIRVQTLKLLKDPDLYFNIFVPFFRLGIETSPSLSPKYDGSAGQFCLRKVCN